VPPVGQYIKLIDCCIMPWISDDA